MTASGKDIDREAARILQYAAMAGRFKPADALAAATGGLTADRADMQLRLLSVLAPVCTIDRQADTDMWTMRVGPRHRLFTALDGKHADLPRVVGDPIAADIPAALDGLQAYAPQALEAAIAAEDFDADALDRQVRVLDRAGPAAPGYAYLDALMALRNRAARDDRNRVALAPGFVGREDELNAVRDWAAGPKILQAKLPTLHISGLPGIGKSFLIERCLQLIRALEPSPIVVRLDFDRSALRVDTPAALFAEISRQIGIERPRLAKRLHAARLDAVEAERDRRVRSDGVPQVLWRAMEEVMADASERLVFMLDTLETLRAQGETHVPRLFGQLDALNGMGPAVLRVISAGRAEAIAMERTRVAVPIDLAGLEDPVAEKLLAARNVPEAAWNHILPVAEGIPLRLVLAGKAASLDAFGEGDLPGDGPEEGSGAAIEGYLYRAVLSRVPRHIRRIANEGLIVHRLNAAVLMEVIGPALGEEIDAARARDFIHDLTSQYWLVKSAGPGEEGWLMHRDDIRATVLNLVYRDSPEVTAEIDRRAAAWFADVHPVTALYHRLQMMRAGADLPDVPPALAREFTGPMLDDLLPRARDTVLQARGELSDLGRDETDVMEAAPPDMSGGTGPETTALWFDAHRNRLRVGKTKRTPIEPDERLARDLEITIARGDLQEARHMLRNGLRKPVAPDGPVARAAMIVGWRIGEWSAARALAKTIPSADLASLSELNNRDVALTKLEIDAEDRFATLVRWLRADNRWRDVRDLVGAGHEVGLPGGALAFALLAAAPPQDWGSTAPPYMQAALAAAGPHMATLEPSVGDWTTQAARRQREALGLSIRDEGRDVAWSGRWLANMTPYAAPLIHLARHFGDPPDDTPDAVPPILGRYLAGLRALAGPIADAYVPWLGGAAPQIEVRTDPAAQTVIILNEMGLTAHWTGAFRTAHRMPDLPDIARATERWRRAANGQWAYPGPPPQGWTDVGTADAESTQVMRLLQDGQAASDAVDLWVRASADEAPEASRRIIERMLGGFDRSGGGEVLPELLDADLAMPLATAFAAALSRRGLDRATASRVLQQPEPTHFRLDDIF